MFNIRIPMWREKNKGIMYNVLIVEANTLTRQALQNMILKDGNFSVVASVGDGEDIFQICRDEKIDLLFLGAILTGRSSVQVVEEMKTIAPALKIYIVAAVRNDPFMKEFLKLKVEEYLILPLTFSKIKEILISHKRKQNYLFEESLVQGIFNLLEQKDYCGIDQTVSAITAQIMAVQDGRHREKMLAIAKGLQDRLEMTCNKVIDFEELFPVKGGFSDNEVYWKFWLTDIIDFTFQKMAVAKCEVLEKVFRMVDEEIDKPLKLEYISLNCNISEGYLNKKVRELMGVSTMDYVQRHKLREAKKRIAFSSMKFSDIAYELGYNESSYFSKVFKKYEGVTPLQFKRIVRS